MAETGRVIVVGAGLSGLTAAALAARAGRDVTVLERASSIGGRATAHALGSASVNQGPHALYKGGAAVETLAELGVAYTGTPPGLGGARAWHGGALPALPMGPASLLTSPLLGWRARLEAAQLFTHMGPKAADERETLETWLARSAKDPDLRALLAAMARLSTYTNAPHLLSARAALAQLEIAQRHGVLYLDGGWSSLVDGLETAARRAGARLLCGATVTGLTRREGAWEVRFGDESLVAEDVVLATGPALAAELTGATFDVVPVHAACLDLCLKPLPADTPRFVLGVDHPTYYSVHSDAARLGPDGTVVLQVAKYIDPRAPVDSAADLAELEALMDLAHPAWRTSVLARRFLPRMTVVNAVVTPRGRPGVDATGLAGVHLAGDWVGPEGMLADTAFASGRRAAHALLRRSATRTKVVPTPAHAVPRS
jgi:phytoene dehydrogenase-like protein